MYQPSVFPIREADEAAITMKICEEQVRALVIMLLNDEADQ